MADLLFGFPCVRQRRTRIYQLNNNILIYSNQKVRTCYRFGTASIEYNTNLIGADLQSKTNCFYVLKPIDQVLIVLQLYASGGLPASCGRYNWSTQVHHFTGSPQRTPYWKQSQCLLTGNCIVGY